MSLLIGIVSCYMTDEFATAGEWGKLESVQRRTAALVMERMSRPAVMVPLGVITQFSYGKPVSRQLFLGGKWSDWDRLD